MDVAAAFEGSVSKIVPAVVMGKLARTYLAYAVVQRVDTGELWLYLADVRGGTRSARRAPHVDTRKNRLRY